MNYVQKIYYDISNNDKKICQKLINNFNKYYNIDILYIRYGKNNIKYNYSSNITNEITNIISEINIENVILDYCYEIKNSLFEKIINFKKYVLVKKIKLDIIDDINYLFLFFDDKTNENIDKINLFHFTLSKELNNLLYKKKINNTEKFNAEICSFLHKISQIKNDNEIDIFLNKVLKLICSYYGFTCGYIVENRNEYFYPINTYTLENHNCHYGLYQYTADIGPWKILHELLKNSSKKYIYLYQIPQQYLTFFKTETPPKSIFISLLSYQKIKIYFVLSNNDKYIFIDEMSGTQLQIISHILYELVCKKNLYQKNLKIEQTLNQKLIEWKKETTELAQESRNISNNLQKYLLKESC